MVLRNVIFIIGLFFCLAFGDAQRAIFKQYQKKIHKLVNKSLDLDKKAVLNFDMISSNGKSTEGYQIILDNQALGYLFLKQVKSCTLNGCLGNEKLTDNIQSEYFDIAVTLDQDKNILSIKVLDYFSDYGYEISSKRYLKKYQGYSICDFSTANSAVDGVSGATVSYNALIGSLGEFCVLLQ